MEKIINITGIESTDKTILLMENKDKYTIWKLDKKTNTESEPYRQFQKFRPVVGDTLKIDVWEQDDSFVNDKGKTINYTKRYINKIITDAEGNPEASVTPNFPTTASFQPPVIPSQPQGQNYQTMSDFELKLLAEIRRIGDGYEKIFNAIKTIELVLPEETKTAMQIHDGDNHLKDFQDKGLEPKSLLDEEEVKTDDVPF